MECGRCLLIVGDDAESIRLAERVSDEEEMEEICRYCRKKLGISCKVLLLIMIDDV